MNLFKFSETDATNFAKQSGFYQDEAVRTPVLVKKNGRPKTVLISYEEFIRLRERDRQAYALNEIPEDIAQAILDAKVPEDLEIIDE